MTLRILILVCFLVFFLDESDAVCAGCNGSCVKDRHCAGGNCGWWWGRDHCHCYGCRRKQTVRDSSSDQRNLAQLLSEEN